MGKFSQFFWAHWLGDELDLPAAPAATSTAPGSGPSTPPACAPRTVVPGSGPPAGAARATRAVVPRSGPSTPPACAPRTVVPVGGAACPVVVSAVGIWGAVGCTISASIIRTAVKGSAGAVIGAAVKTSASPSDDRRGTVIGRSWLGGVVAGAARLRKGKNSEERRLHEPSE